MSKHSNRLHELPPELQDWNQREAADRRNYAALIRRDAERLHATLEITSPAADQDAAGRHAGETA